MNPIIPLPTNPRFRDLTGLRYGRLVVIAFVGVSGPRRTLWLCQCDCGNQKTTTTRCLNSGYTQSCGCLLHDRLIETKTKHGHRGPFGHPSPSPTYRTWASMIQRCINQNTKTYPRYGGRGITVCDAWRSSFEAFLADMGERPVDTELDRIDNDLGYYADNCRWVSRRDQVNNRSNTRLLTFKDETKPISRWAEEYGLTYFTLYGRLRSGWPVEEALGIKKKAA